LGDLTFKAVNDGIWGQESYASPCPGFFLFSFYLRVSSRTFAAKIIFLDFKGQARFPGAYFPSPRGKKERVDF
jgi:hypothetical protein